MKQTTHNQATHPEGYHIMEKTSTHRSLLTCSLLLLALHATPLSAGFQGGAPPPGVSQISREQAIGQGQLVARNAALSDDYGYTPIHIAASKNNIKTINILLSNGADINAHGIDGATALHIAASHGHTQLLAILLKAGALPNIRDKNNKQAIDYAVDAGQIESVRILTDPDNITVAASTPEPKTHPLHWAAQNGDLATLKRQLKHTDINHPQGEYQWTALHMAAIGGAIETIKLLLDKGADQQAIELEYQRTALHLAAILGHVTAVKLLATAATLDTRDSQTETALHMSSDNGHLPVVQTLISAGADINTQTDYGDTALTLAINGGHTDVARWLLSQGAEISSAEDSNILHQAIRHGQSELISKLIKKGKHQLDTINEDGEAPLHAAAMLGDTQASLALLRAGADINIRTDDILGGKTALHLAVFHGHDAIARQLLQHGIDINIRQTESDKTALHLAAEDQQLSDMAQLLIAQGADVNAISREPDTIATDIATLE